MGKKLRWAATVALVVVAAAHSLAFGDEKKPDSDARLTAIEKRLDRIEELLKQRGALGALLGSPPAEPTPAPANTRLSVIKWSAVFHQGEYRFEDYWHLSYTVKNEYEKTVKLIDGSLEFSDLLGDKIVGVRLLPDVKIEPGHEQTFTANYRHSFDNRDQRLRTIAHDDVRVALRIRRLMFSDNTALEFP